ncbi:hypothetical protein GCK32_016564 [Trichostrongylus colubriformis]|uniref:Uncharacterized protein n=1 Tax=Trichostrongylus colubriformis TaxID=6319 RepID=A0AAN8J2I3_TRICO
MSKEIVHEASYDRKPDGTLVMHINGMAVRQTRSGDITVDARPRVIQCSPFTASVHVRSSYIDMGVQENEKAYVKRGLKRVHVSRSGMVVSDDYLSKLPYRLYWCLCSVCMRVDLAFVVARFVLVSGLIVRSDVLHTHKICAHIDVRIFRTYFFLIICP